MTEAEERRFRRFPDAVDHTIRKLKNLACEARRYGDKDMLTRLDAMNEAWERAVTEAQADSIARGESIGFGDGKR